MSTKETQPQDGVSPPANGNIPFDEKAISRIIKSYAIYFAMLLAIYFQENFNTSELQYQILIVEFILDFIRDNLNGLNYKQIPFFLILLYFQKPWLNLIYIFGTTSIGFDVVMNNFKFGKKLRILDYLLIVNYIFVYVNLINYENMTGYIVAIGHFCLFLNWFT
ncbi:unnamed protein product [Candida verbasci]|uniref:Uncharacterized protein n=1 Tax=Candida verbasci TaxID=1227364 RepID=A0A9W4TXU0_9ASCO|nr:unnamed protein product [Candida verbasci]